MLSGGDHIEGGNAPSVLSRVGRLRELRMGVLGQPVQIVAATADYGLIGQVAGGDGAVVLFGQRTDGVEDGAGRPAFRRHQQVPMHSPRFCTSCGAVSKLVRPGGDQSAVFAQTVAGG